MAPHITYIIFLFAVGACIGSFLNVVVWRLPRGESLVSPPSHCPQCNHKLAWFDNIPIFGWLALRGKCRYCKNPISARYPIIELLTALLFVGYYVAYFVYQARTCCPMPPGQALNQYGEAIGPRGSVWDITQHWPIFGLYLLTISALLAASLIDAELFIIPIEIPWLIGIVGVIVHAIIDRPNMPGALNLITQDGLPSWSAALSAGASLGLLLSMLLWWRGFMPTSFPNGEPVLDVDREAYAIELAERKKAGEDVSDIPPLPPEYTKPQVRAEIRKEMLFLLPPMVLGGLWLALTLTIPSLGKWWIHAINASWITGLLGSLLGAMVGAVVVWFTRVLATLIIGRVAMGLGDVHLMLGVGAVLGAGPAVITFFLAPFFGILVAIYKLVTRSGREMPLGPYLSMAAACVMLSYCPIEAYLTPGLHGLILLVTGNLQ